MSYAIRLADRSSAADIEHILYGARQFFGFMDDDALFPVEALPQVCDTLLSIPFFHTLLAISDDDRLLGGIGGMVAPYMWDARKISCEELFWWAVPEAPASVGMRLLNRHIDYGKERGATVFVFHELAISPEGVGKVFRRKGTKPMQTTYMGAL